MRAQYRMDRLGQRRRESKARHSLPEVQRYRWSGEVSETGGKNILDGVRLLETEFKRNAINGTGGGRLAWEERAKLAGLIAKEIEVDRAEITSLRAQLDEARNAFEKIRKHTRKVRGDDLIIVIDMIAEDFLDPSKRAPLRAPLSKSKP